MAFDSIPTSTTNYKRTDPGKKLTPITRQQAWQTYRNNNPGDGIPTDGFGIDPNTGMPLAADPTTGQSGLGYDYQGRVVKTWDQQQQESIAYQKQQEEWRQGWAKIDKQKADGAVIHEDAPLSQDQNNALLDELVGYMQDSGMDVGTLDDDGSPLSILAKIRKQGGSLPFMPGAKGADENSDAYRVRINDQINGWLKAVRRGSADTKALEAQKAERIKTDQEAYYRVYGSPEQQLAKQLAARAR